MVESCATLHTHNLHNLLFHHTKYKRLIYCTGIHLVLWAQHNMVTKLFLIAPVSLMQVCCFTISK